MICHHPLRIPKDKTHPKLRLTPFIPHNMFSRMKIIHPLAQLPQ